MAEEDDEDYMSMPILEPTQPKEKETYTQRRIRKQRESEIKSRTKSKKDLEADALVARNAALAAALPPDSKGFKMMAKLGYKQGDVLGPSATASTVRAEPLDLAVKDDKGGIGLDNEKKRKFREEWEEEAQRKKADELGYRERVRMERENERLEGLCRAAARIAESLAEDNKPMETTCENPKRTKEDRDGEANSEDNVDPEDKKDNFSIQKTVTKNMNTHQKGTMARMPIQTKAPPPTNSIPVLWRGLTRQRQQQERKRCMRHDLLQSLSRNTSYADENAQDRQAFGTEEEEVEDEYDTELDEWDALEPEDRLRKLVHYLRERWRYCLWCKFRYEDEMMEGCPGVEEDEHG